MVNPRLFDVWCEVVETRQIIHLTARECGEGIERRLIRQLPVTIVNERGRVLAELPKRVKPPAVYVAIYDGKPMSRRRSKRITVAFQWRGKSGSRQVTQRVFRQSRPRREAGIRSRHRVRELCCV